MSSFNSDLIFKALADPTRRKILDLIRDSPMTTGDINKRFKNLDRCTVMLHMKKLEDANLLIVKREGKYRWNYINTSPIQRIYNRWIKGYAEPAANLLEKISSQMN